MKILVGWAARNVDIISATEYCELRKLSGRIPQAVELVVQVPQTEDNLLSDYPGSWRSSCSWNMQFVRQYPGSWKSVGWRQMRIVLVFWVSDSNLRIAEGFPS